MQPDYLIDSVLRLTARLLATLTTLDGQCADLSGVGTRLRNYVARELGPPRNRIALVASAFGVSETSVYQWRRDALRAASFRKTDRDWLLEHIHSHQGERLRRENLEAAFVAMVRADSGDEGDPDAPLAPSTLASIRGRFDTALWLLRKADLVFATASKDPLYFSPDQVDSEASIASLVWLEIYERSALTPVTRGELSEGLPFDASALEAALGVLEKQGRVERIAGEREPAFRCTELYLPVDDDDEAHSLEVAALDHLRVVIDTLVERFEQRAIVTGPYAEQRRNEAEALRERFDAKNGIVSWRYDLWAGHPRETEILELGEKLVSMAHQLSLETRSIEGPKAAERVLYLGMHTRSASGEDQDLDA